MDEICKEFKIAAKNELRIEITMEPISLMLIEGSGEIFGKVLVPNIEYTFDLCSIAIFTWTGCIVTIVAEKQEHIIAYSPTTEHGSMIQCINLHNALSKTKNPKLMIVGSANVGKTTIAKILANYIAREVTETNKTMFIDLNVEKSEISSIGGGTIGCGTIIKPSWDFSEDLIEILLLHFGHVQVRKNIEFYKSQCETLNKLILQKQQMKNENTANIILTPSKNSVGEKDYYLLILHLSKIFRIDCLLVVGDEALYQKLERDSELDQNITVKIIEKFAGSIEKSPHDRKLIQQNKIKKYFRDFLPLSKPLYSRTNELQIVRIVSSELSKEQLPIGKERLGQDFFHQETVVEEKLNFFIGSIVEYNNGEDFYKQPILGFAKILDSNPNNVSISTIGNLPFTNGGLLLMDYKTS